MERGRPYYVDLEVFHYAQPVYEALLQYAQRENLSLCAAIRQLLRVALQLETEGADVPEAAKEEVYAGQEPAH